MTAITPSIRIHVVPTNPGHFFACRGLLELADRLWQGAAGWFENGKFCEIHQRNAGKVASPSRDARFSESFWGV